ncbi:putative aldose reductase [Cardiosporidium cionae]|uniref:Aldose reductase n=1 Tax=Cardiosporidium cionae TaxID=476202 RepID=A0ABQ7J6J3_9APIC|nr:putative aldose reductase [Cardiosporidium cionae]|eukprot:KAF8819616.1 putative aldose reductase [Cardiosporidium cionae]
MASGLVTLRNGVKMPRLGLGTWQLRDKTCYNSVCSALKVGYQLIDTASSYQNQSFVGKALKEAECKPPAFLFETANKNNVFVTTKVSFSEMGYEKAYANVIHSLELLGMDSIDLVLLHFPGSSGIDASSSEHRHIRRESWRALEKLYEEKRIRAIGVSNYHVHHLNQLLEDKVDVVPMVNQLEFHPFLQYKELEEWAVTHSMFLQSYSTLGTGSIDLLEHPTISAIAKEIGSTTAQTILRWALYRNYLIIPRSSNVKRIEENFHCTDFSLSESQIAKISDLENGKRFCWDPSKIA